LSVLLRVEWCRRFTRVARLGSGSVNQEWIAGCCMVGAPRAVVGGKLLTADVATVPLEPDGDKVAQRRLL
jgi:hypothetical protein